MKKFKLNPEAKEVELRIVLGIDLLQTEGWDFSDYHSNTAEVLGMSEEDAEQYNLNNYQAEIILETRDDGNIATFVNWTGKEETGKEETGDDKQTIADIISLLEDGLIRIDDSMDYTTNEIGKYVPTFIQA